METTATSPIEQALLRLEKLDDQLKRGLITKQEMDTERLTVLIDLLIAKGV